MKILVVDDQRSARRILKRYLSGIADIQVHEADSVETARRVVEAEDPDLLLLDIRLADSPADRGGLEILSWLRASGRTTPAVMVTASTEMAGIREAMRHGAQDYVLKDELEPEMIVPIVEGLRERAHLRGEVTALRRRVSEAWGPEGLVGSSPGMERVRRLVERVADADTTILIRGETGTGKELVARALHELSSRHDAPFVPVNCSALPGNLIESMIFGHEKGAFTGADRRTRGHMELAGDGTILLDEIAEMPPELQAKLLRVLEDRRFRPLGSEVEHPLRARVLAATHVDLEDRVRSGAFREDLYFRLNVVSIEVPPLSERRDDIPELLAAFVRTTARELHFDKDAIAWLQKRAWPGNVRELRNVVERLALLADDDEITEAALDELVGAHALGSKAADIDHLARHILALPVRRGSKLDVIERAVLHHAIETCGGNKSAAARLIGVNRKALERRWDRLADRSPTGSDPPEEPEGRGEN